MLIRSLNKFLELVKKGTCPPELCVDLSPSFLKFGNIPTGAEGVPLLAEALKSGQCPQGLSIELGFNQLGAESARLLAEALKSGQCPQGLSIDLEYNQLGAEGVRLLAEALKSGQCPQGLSIDLGSNRAGAEGIRLLAEAFKSGQCPQGLRIPSDNNPFEEVYSLSNVLKNAKSKGGLPLALGWDQSGNIYAKTLAQFIASGQCPSGIELYLAWENITDEGLEALAQSLQSNNCPKALTLNFQGNYKITDKGIKALAEALAQQPGHQVQIILHQNYELCRLGYQPQITTQNFPPQPLGYQPQNYQPQQLGYQPKANPKSFLTYYKRQATSSSFIKPNPQSFKKESKSLHSTPSSGTHFSWHFKIPYNELSLQKDSNNNPIQLGQGGFGRVYKGTWQGNDVAIKQLLINNPTDNSKKAFGQETQIMFQIRHPNIMPLYGICLEPGHYSMVIEYMPKGSLHHVLGSQEQLDWPKRWQIALDIGKGILHLHSHNIVHRDLKSLNVLLDSQYRAKVSDFGLARIKEETRTTTANAQTNQKVGTLAWMAPELFVPKPKYSKAADIYSYGMILWELAARKSPHASCNPNLLAMFILQGHREDIPQNTPDNYAKLIKWCWKAEPKERPSIEQAVEHLAQHQPSL